MIWNTSKLSVSHLSRATAIFVVDCCQFGASSILKLKVKLMAWSDLVGGTTNQISLFPDLIWYYNWYGTLPNCLHHTSGVPQPFLLLIAANLALAWVLGWKLSLWPVPTWMEVERSKAVFLLTLYDSINDMKHFQIVSISPQSCRSHFCCWLLPIWRKLDSWAESGANGLCWLGWRYNKARLSFP